MLEFLANVDAMSLPLWAILLVSACMYPIGILLPCGRCCLPPCETCEEGELPNTITVTFNGFPESSASPGPDLIHMAFSSCYGLGAEARVTAPGGDPDTDAGPISAVTVTNGGSGYAKLGRVEPSVAASGGSGTGATLTVTLAEDADDCGIPFWKVASVSVADGTGYADGDPVTFTIAEGDTEASAASATIHTTRNEPTLSASAPLGSGAAFTLSYTKNAGPPETWTISSVSVTSGGTGYHGGDSLTITLDTDDVEQSAAYTQIVTSRSEPTLSASVSSETGSGATFSVSLSTTYDAGGDAWAVSSLGIEDGGYGYAVDDAVLISVDDGEQAPYEAAYAYVSSVDENGAITGIEIGYGGVYYKDDGIITSVEIYYGGAYYKDDGVPVSVSVDGGGVYYREDSTEPPYVAEVTVSIAQTLPSNGTGATFSAVVDDDPSSPTFGRVTSITAEDGGDGGYLAWQWVYKKHCCDAINGVPIVLQRNSALPNPGGPFADNSCTYKADTCSLPALLAYVRVVYKGPGVPPELALYSPLCALNRALNDDASADQSGAFVTETLITNCDEFSFTATGTFRGTEVTAMVEPGGDYDTAPISQDNCFVCCKGSDNIPPEVTASFTGETVADYDGDYVLTRYETLGGSGTAADPKLRRWYALFPEIAGASTAWPAFPAGIALSIEPCSVRLYGGFGSLADTSDFPYLTNSVGSLVDDAATCNRCHNECMTYAYAAGFFALNTGPYAPLPFSHQGAMCDDVCKPTPICSPSTGEYVIPGFGTVSVA